MVLNAICDIFSGVASLTKELDEFELAKTEARAVTGVLASHPNSTDVHISSLSLTFHGQELLADTSLELNSGRRYGLIGLNGTGRRSYFFPYKCLTTLKSFTEANRNFFYIFLTKEFIFVYFFLQENPCCCQLLDIVKFPFRSTSIFTT